MSEDGTLGGREDLASLTPAQRDALMGVLPVPDTRPRVGDALYEMLTDLYPLCRSITGEGLRETLRRIQERIGFTLHEVPTGTRVLDWEIPEEWSIRSGWIETLDGKVLVDFQDSNLHVVSYSTAVDAVVTRDELSRHVYTLPDQPSLIPYRTGYYNRDWGFCLRHDVWEAMQDDHYRVRIDAGHSQGAMSYGELLIPGESTDEVLISVHCCHPSLANDNLSGVVIATELARLFQQSPKRKLSYRFLFVPGTIGAITWLARNDVAVSRTQHGLVLSCLGDRGPFHYKQSRDGDAIIDRATDHVLRHSGQSFEIRPFSPYGYDERQYCSPAYNLNVGCIMRGHYGEFREYHTSADNLGFVTPEALEESFVMIRDILDVLDANVYYRRVDGRGEPQLGRRGLYRAISGQKEAGGASQMALLWALNLADGQHSMLDMTERAGVSFRALKAAIDLAQEAGLIREATSPLPMLYHRQKHAVTDRNNHVSSQFTGGANSRSGTFKNDTPATAFRYANAEAPPRGGRLFRYIKRLMLFWGL